MMKFRAILTSFLLLLIFGVNENVWASADAKKEVSQQPKDEQSEGNSQQEEENEKITEWDFFGAFSLVNVQLQWRDLHLGVVEEPTQTESSEGQRDISFEAVVTDFFAGDSQDLPLPVVVSTPSVIAKSCCQVFTTLTNYTCDHNVQSEQTIFYIQNSGTYPEHS